MTYHTRFSTPWTYGGFCAILRFDLGSFIYSPGNWEAWLVICVFGFEAAISVHRGDK